MNEQLQQAFSEILNKATAGVEAGAALLQAFGTLDTEAIAKTGVTGKEVIEKIKEQNDIVDIISENVRLKKSGRNYMGLCPFHKPIH